MFTFLFSFSYSIPIEFCTNPNEIERFIGHFVAFETIAQMEEGAWKQIAILSLGIGMLWVFGKVKLINRIYNLRTCSKILFIYLFIYEFFFSLLLLSLSYLIR